MIARSARRDSQERADRLRIFREEFEQLSQKGVIPLTEEQRAAVNVYVAAELSELATRFDVDVSEDQRQLSLGMKIVSGFGALALSAAVFLLFYRYWGLIGTTTQVIILLAAPLMLLPLLPISARRERTLYITAIIAAVAFASFVLDLSVLGSLFNITPSPNAFLAWAAFACAIAYVYRLRLLLAAGLVCGIAFASGTIMTWTGAWWSAWSRPESILIPGALVVAASLLIRNFHDEFAGVYRLIGLVTVFSSLLALWHSGRQSWIPVGHTAIERGYQVIAFSAAAVTIFVGIRFHLGGTTNLGTTAFAVYLILKFVDWWWDWLPKYLFFFIVGIIAIGLLWMFRRLREKAG